MSEWAASPEQRARTKAWRNAHAEELRVKKAAWHAANRKVNLAAMKRRWKREQDECRRIVESLRWKLVIDSAAERKEEK